MKETTKIKIKTVWAKIKIAVKEIGNFLTDALCPVVSAITILATALQAPASFIKTLKKIEAWLWAASGTTDDVDVMVDVIDKAVTKITEEEKKEK